MFKSVEKHALLIGLLLISGCSTLSPNNRLPDPAARIVMAQELATTAGLESASIVTRKPSGQGFRLQAFYRQGNSSQPISVYIEGDGHAWGRTAPSPNPTPTNPLALRLATLDKADQLLYLGRPCQFTLSACQQKYWTSHRMSTEVIEAYGDALQQWSIRTGNSQFRLVGFSGGGGIAALLAAHIQNDPSLGIKVVDLRTIAGNLNHQQWTTSLNLLPLTGSLNPSDQAQALKQLPQLHFIGSADVIIPPSIYQSYRQSLGASGCVHHKMLDAQHVRGWLELWPSLLNQQPKCL